jgi:MarR family 2-MHQ and catechol resistance regulon transcriptional repressor
MKAHRALMRKAERSIADTGMCLSDFAILEILLHKGALPVNTLADKIGLTSGSGTSAIDRLESRRLVERRSDPGDRRTRIVHLTPAGRTLIERAFAHHADDMERAASVLNSRERATLLELLRKLGKAAEERDQNGSPDTANE